jgi:ATP-dependent DNA helicase RecQ
LDKIKTFGIGRDVPFLDWKHYVTQMINQGLVSIDFTDKSKLKSTPLSNPILKGESTIMLSKFIPNDKKPKVKEPKLSIDVGNADQDLLAALKAWRLGLAKSQKVPAYVIMNNKALDQISSMLPSNSSELLVVDGVGRVKLMKYGDAILKIVKEYG